MAGVKFYKYEKKAQIRWNGVEGRKEKRVRDSWSRETIYIHSAVGHSEAFDLLEQDGKPLEYV